MVQKNSFCTGDNIRTTPYALLDKMAITPPFPRDLIAYCRGIYILEPGAKKGSQKERFSSGRLPCEEERGNNKKKNAERSAHAGDGISHGRLDEPFTANGCFHNDMGTFGDRSDNHSIPTVFVRTKGCYDCIS
jgi:hypothetical protein